MPSWLVERFRDLGDLPALIWHDRPTTYRALAERVEFWQERLAGAGGIVSVVGDRSEDAVAALLALLALGATAVPLCSMPSARHERCFEIAGVNSVLDLTEEGDGLLRCRIAGPPHPLQQRLRAEGRPGLVLFSSGSTGDPKAALWDAGRLFEKHREAHRVFRTLVFLRLDHIGGLNTLAHALAGGGTLIVPADREADAVCRSVERHRVELLPGTPTFLKMLLIARAPERFDLSSLELITYGTEPMPPGTLHDLCAALPHVRFKQTYGLSELGILPTQSRERDSLWLRLGGAGIETRVANGELWVRTPTAMLGYLNAESPFDADGWFNTHDAVEVDGEFIRILGRASELINVGGEKVYPAEVEDVLLQAGNVREAAVHGKRNAVTGQVVAATVTLLAPEEPDAAERRLLAYCRPRLAPHQVPVLIDVADGPLHTERGKILRRPAGGERG